MTDGTGDTANSALSNAITVNAAPTITITSTPLSGSVDAGQTITYNALVTGGSPSYTYTFDVYNSVTHATRQLSHHRQTNSFVFTTNSNLIGNTLNANVFVTDGKETRKQCTNKRN